MSRVSRRVLLTLLLCPALALCAKPASAAEPYLIEAAALPSPAALPQSLLDGLNPQGSLLYTFSNGLKEPICEIFLAKAIAAQGAPGVAHKMQYGNLSPGTLIGVIHLLREATEDYYVDFHSQKLKPGYYTLRYALLPAGTYAHGPVLGEFVVLSPAGRDRDPAQILPRQELMQLGNSVSGSNQPASLQLVPADPKSKAPAMTEDDQGVGTFQARLILAPGEAGPSHDLPLAMIVLTPAPHPEGS